jgi:hypothetical protein
MDSSNWQAVVKKLFPGIYEATWHTSLYAFVCDLAVKLGEGGAAGGGNGVEQGWGCDGLAASAGAVAGGVAGGVLGQKQQKEQRQQQQKGQPWGERKQQQIVSSPSPQQQQERVVMYAFLGGALKSKSLYVQTSTVLAMTACLGDKEQLVQGLAYHLPAGVLCEVLLPVVKQLQPDMYGELLVTAQSRLGGNVAVAGVEAPQQLQQVLLQLEGLLGVYPGVEIWTLAHVAQQHGIMLI